MKTFREFLNESTNKFKMSIFKETDDFIIMSSPGPMKVTGNMVNSLYRNGEKIRIPTDEQIDKSLKYTKEDYKNMVWYEPGGYALWVQFYKNNNIMVIFGRPNNANGASILLEVKNASKTEFNKQVKEFNNIDKVRNYLKKFHGKSIKWLNEKVLAKIKSGDIDV